MNPQEQHHNSSNNVIGIFSKKYRQTLATPKIKRLAAELDGWQMLYKTPGDHRLYSLPVLCWALLDDDSIQGMVPWLTHLVSCESLKLSNGGHWEGYFLESSGITQAEPPLHKIAELEAFSRDDYKYSNDTIVQEIPDLIGTHAILSEDNLEHITLIEVFSWQLLANGTAQGMLIDPDFVEQTPVLLGANCLTPAESDDGFMYYFHNGIASKLKAKDPEAIDAIAALAERLQPKY